MALVNYSDSEASDAESPPAAPAPTPATASAPKPKLINRTDNKKIKVDLPRIRPEPGQQDGQEPAAKRARTAGAFSGFNSLLPAPKRTGQNAPKPGVSLKTSSEAAFSRTPVPILPGGETGGDDTLQGHEKETSAENKEEQPKPVGKPTRFMPLSVANAKKKKPNKPVAKAPIVDNSIASSHTSIKQAVPQPNAKAEEPPKPKPKASLFSFGGQDATPSAKPTGEYKPEFSSHEPDQAVEAESTNLAPIPAPASSNTLSDVASDLDLTPAQRRQLFGRNGVNSGNIAHFNMDAEYRSNQEMAASGETFEHRQVKAIAPGKHSLQQLVNNVKSQADALEDKWAEGRRNRGDGGSKYGF